MSRPLRVVIYGALDAGPCDTIRFGALRPPLTRAGVDLLPWDSIAAYQLFVSSKWAADPAAAVAAGRATIDLSPITEADVLVLRRWYSTAQACADCDVVEQDHAALLRHARRRGHRPAGQDLHARVLLDAIARDPGILGESALVYETDDNLFAVDAALGFRRRLVPELPDVHRILTLADLVTTTTPVLADRLAGQTGAPVRIIRNALDPDWYRASPDPDLTGSPRVLYHGVARRLADYGLARPAVDAMAQEMPGLRRVWLGADDPAVRAVVDELRPYVAGIPAFARSLVAAGPDIGLAPLVDTPYNRARSELHWLEYALAGAPTIVSGFEGPGPYDVVRDGLDGLVARTPDDWYRHLRALALSADLRAEIAGRARERVLAEYTVASRALEWADAYRWAAEHAGARRRAVA